MSISVTVTISTVYPGSTGGAIFSGHDIAGKYLRFVAGRDRIFRVPIVGEAWLLEGVSRRHPKYGDQVHVEQAILVAPSGRLVIDFLVRHPAFNGLRIGKARARRLWEEFGQDLGAVLGQGDMEKLTRVLSAECAQKLVEAWRAVSDEAGIVAFLDQHGFDLHLANKIRKVWPRDTLAKLRENPYRMLTFSAWEKVDRMARLLGVADDDPRRWTAAVEACLYRRLDAKHTLTSVGTLGDAVMAALRCGESTARGAIDHACRGHAIVAAAHGYQPVGAAVMENAVASYLRALLAGVPGPQRNLFSGNLASIVAASIDLLALQIERRYTKPQIFTMYSNQVYLAHGNYGFAAAAQFYFGKSVTDLKLQEAALLAGMIRGPIYSPLADPARALARRNLVIHRMEEEGKITPVEEEAAKKTPLGLHLQYPRNDLAPYFFEEIRKYLESTYGTEAVHERGLRVYTTLNIKMQQAANQSLRDGLHSYDRRHGWRGITRWPQHSRAASADVRSKAGSSSSAVSIGSR